MVGFALHANCEEYDERSGKGVPCHRVVNRFGGLAAGFAFGGEKEQRLRLAAEGVKFAGRVVDKASFVRL